VPKIDASSAAWSHQAVDHIAILATDPENFAVRFVASGLAARRRFFPEFQLCQTFVGVPDGHTIELLFRRIAMEPARGADSESHANRKHTT
jgi:hypothetical protein